MTIETHRGYEMFIHGLMIRNLYTLILVGLACGLVLTYAYFRQRHPDKSGDLRWHILAGFYATLIIFTTFAGSVH